MSGPGGLKRGTEITDDYLDGLKKDDWFKINVKDEDATEFLERAADQIKRHQRGVRQALQGEAGQDHRRATTWLRAC